MSEGDGHSTTSNNFSKDRNVVYTSSCRERDELTRLMLNFGAIGSHSKKQPKGKKTVIIEKLNGKRQCCTKKHDGWTVEYFKRTHLIPSFVAGEIEHHPKSKENVWSISIARENACVIARPATDDDGLAKAKSYLPFMLAPQ